MKNGFKSSSQSNQSRRRLVVASAVSAIALPLLFAAPRQARADDVSAPAMLQWFEASWNTMENRTPDLFAAGYGGVWIPPPGQANTGAASVGYDVYDRFDLGSASNPTRYGTQTGLQAAIKQFHLAGGSVYSDLVWNHDGTSDASTTSGSVSFSQAGGYPGLAITLQNTDPTKPGYNTQGYNDVDGDFHSSYASTDQTERLAGLVDIAQEKNNQFIRNPVNAGDPRNIPAGTVGIYGRPAANTAKASNAQFYPDKDLGGTTVYDPKTGQNVTLYNFNSTTPTAGDAVPENATGYLMRQARWMVQTIGVDGFRIDAAKNMPSWVLNYYDEAVMNANPRLQLDGSQKKVFAYSEVYDSNFATLQSYIRKDSNSLPSNQVSGNRDDLDFPLFFAMQSNLSSNGLANDWRNIKNASIDVNDDGLANNGSQGVSFVSSADNGPPALSNVAYAYTLMRPGNTIVYDNAKSISGSTFPQDGRGDALGGVYGDTITKLVDIRNTHGRGNYLDRTPTADAKEMLIYERSDSALVVLSNRLDSGVDNRTVQTNFKPGTPLLELTGNAASTATNPTGILPQVVVVNADGTANITVPRNLNVNGTETDKGYLIYGPSGPQGAVSLSNVSSTLAGVTPSASNNSTGRIANVSVITAANFNVTLSTKQVNLLGSIRDVDADGNSALLSIDNSVDVNGNGFVDNKTPGTLNYGFDNFLTVNQPGYGNTATNNVGTYVQTVDTSKLSEGYHYIDARAFRRRDAGEPEIFTDFKQTIYVDRFKPVSAVNTFDQGSDVTTSQTRDLTIKSVDQTATSVNVFLDLPASTSDATVKGYVGTGNVASAIDRDLYTYRYFNVGSGYHVATVVTKEIDGNTNVQRLVIGNISTSKGSGLGDLNYDGTYAAGDVTGTSYGMESLIYPTNINAPVDLITNYSNTTYNGAADINGDGLIDSRDLYAQRDRFVSIGAPAAAIAAAKAAVLRRGDVNGDGYTNAADIDALYAHRGNTAWRYDLNSSAWSSFGNGPLTNVGADQADVDTLVMTIFQTRYGDADLSGRIDANDYAAIDSGFQLHLTGWAHGDFTGDGLINADDYALIDVNYQLQSNSAALVSAMGLALLTGGEGALAPFGSDARLVAQHAGEFGAEYINEFVYTAVPEPTVLGISMIGMAGFVLKRRARR